MTLAQTLQWLSQKLYPKGRAFRMPDEGIFWRMHRAQNTVLATALQDANQVLNDILPDNADFDISDAHDWYRRLGIYDSGTVPLADMKKAIAQKLSFPLVPLNKQSAQYIQDQLQAAGFNVDVIENRFPDGLGGYTTKTPDELLSIAAGDASLGGFNLGEVNLGSQWIDDGITLIANYIEEDKDALFDFGDNYRSTFYIGKAPGGVFTTTFATVPASRKIEFRQLLLKLKPAQTAGFLFVNYI